MLWWAVGRFKWLIKFIGGQVMVELSSDCSLECLIDEWEVGDLPKVAKVMRFQANLLQDGSDGGSFQTHPKSRM